MDPILIIIAAVAAAVIAFFILQIYRRGSAKAKPEAAAGVVRPVAPRELPHGRRNVRQRLRAGRQRQQQDSDSDFLGSEDEDEIAIDYDKGDGSKIGAKKRKKLELKAEKKQQREAEQQEREEKKKRDEELEKIRAKQEKKEKEKEAAREEELRLEKEEEQRKEEEEYQKLKEAFQVDEEGFDESQNMDESSSLLQEFIRYIKENKVVMMEDLASHFKLKTQEAIDRIETLQEDKILTGVMDDRGKFIYITEHELQEIAKFVKQRGRISISDLVDSSNVLVNLQPVTTTTAPSTS